MVADSGDSLLAMIGRLIAPVFIPLGFGDWRASTALISGFAAKESVISTLGILLGSSADVAASLGTLFTPATAFSFLIFTLLYTPCIAAVTAVKRELGAAYKAVGFVVLQCGIAWIASFLIYRMLLLLIG